MRRRCGGDGSYVVTSAPLTYGAHSYGYTDLVYSPRCGANWATAGTWFNNVGGLRLSAWVTRPGGPYRPASEAGGSNGSWTYTLMVYAPNNCAYAKGSLDLSYADASGQTPCR